MAVALDEIGTRPCSRADGEVDFRLKLSAGTPLAVAHDFPVNLPLTAALDRELDPELLEGICSSVSEALHRSRAPYGVERSSHRMRAIALGLFPVARGADRIT